MRGGGQSPAEAEVLREQLAEAQRRAEQGRRSSQSAEQVERLQERLRTLDEQLMRSREQLALQEQTVTATAGAAERLLMESWAMDAETPAAAGDVLSIQIADEPALPRAYRVDQEGRIRLPFVGQIRVQGLTAEQVQAEVSRQLVATNLKTNPSVTVSLRRPGGER
jgi:protein involved in polysaccharide export with SLBB domain